MIHVTLKPETEERIQRHVGTTHTTSTYLIEAAIDLYLTSIERAGGFCENCGKQAWIDWPSNTKAATNKPEMLVCHACHALPRERLVRGYDFETGMHVTRYMSPRQRARWARQHKLPVEKEDKEEEGHE